MALQTQQTLHKEQVSLLIGTGTPCCGERGSLVLFDHGAETAPRQCSQISSSIWYVQKQRDSQGGKKTGATYPQILSFEKPKGKETPRALALRWL